MKVPVLYLFVCLVFFIYGCSGPAATQMKHGGEFSNIRSEVRLVDGTTLMGYASINLSKGEDAVRLTIPGERTERKIYMAYLDRILMEEHEYVVKWVVTPGAARREGKLPQTRTLVKRMGLESDPVQVFEYKYPVRNPKSPLNNTLTAWFVSFPGDQPNKPLCELGSHCYKQKWEELQLAYNQKMNSGLHAPGSVKQLLEQVRKLEPPEVQSPNFTAGD